MPQKHLKSQCYQWWNIFRRKNLSNKDNLEAYQYRLFFPRLPITVPPLVPTIMAYRWNDDDDCESSPKKFLRDNHHQCQQRRVRRRIPKRYSDVVGPISNQKNLSPRRNSSHQQKHTNIPLDRTKQQRTSFKQSNHQSLYRVNSHNRQSTEIHSKLSTVESNGCNVVKRRYSTSSKRLSTTYSVDHLAHRMQAAMSSELMHSLDRNFVFTDKKLLNNCSNVNRSYSFNIASAARLDSQNAYHQQSYHFIPRAKLCIDEKRKSMETVNSYDEITPDYDDEINISPINVNNNNYDDIDEEPAVDYDDELFDEKPSTQSTNDNIAISSSITIPMNTSLTPTTEHFTEDQSPMPPIPPPLPVSFSEKQNITFRCRTIADTITTDHKLILKDNIETEKVFVTAKSTVPTVQETNVKTSQSHSNTVAKPQNTFVTKEILDKKALKKVAHPVCRSYSIYGSISHFNDPNMDVKILQNQNSANDEQPLDGLSSSATASIVIENEYEHRSSSKIYNEYKRQASSTSIPANNLPKPNRHHSTNSVHPIHTHIGFRSSSSSLSASEKPNETNLPNKQINVCVINQLNEHLTTRFRQHESRNSPLSKSMPSERLHDQLKEDLNNQTETNLYDVPQNGEPPKKPLSDDQYSSIPPPPPPLPAGGFRSLVPQTFRPTSSQRTSLVTLSNETNNSDTPCGTGNSTASSKLSDTRILRELRTNPLFAKAKQHLEIEPGSNGRRSGRRLHEASSYGKIDPSSKQASSPNCNNDSNVALNVNRQNREYSVMNRDKCNDSNVNITKRTKSMNSKPDETSRLPLRSSSKSFLYTQHQPSELEIIFRKRAQRNEPILAK